MPTITNIGVVVSGFRLKWNKGPEMTAVDSGRPNLLSYNGHLAWHVVINIAKITRTKSAHTIHASFHVGKREFVTADKCDTQKYKGRASYVDTPSRARLACQRLELESNEPPFMALSSN